MEPNNTLASQMNTLLAICVVAYAGPLLADGGMKINALFVKDATVVGAPDGKDYRRCEAKLGEWATELESKQAPPSGWKYVEASTQTIACPQTHTGFVQADAVVLLKDFNPVTKWTGPSSIALEGGDWGGVYTFSGDGSFTLKDSTTKRGRMFQSGNVLLARFDKDKTTFEVFVLDPEKGLCWPNRTGICKK